MNYNNKLTQPTLDFNDKIIDARKVFDDYHCHTLVVLENNIFKGLLFSEDIEDLADQESLQNLEPILKKIYLTPNFSIFDWFKMSSLHGINNIPLIDSDNFSYLSSVNYDDFAEKFKDTGLNVELSSILILKKATEDFNYSEIFQIAEAHDARIFGSYINFSDQNETDIVINLHHTGLNELLQSYRRYDFEVISFHDEDLHHETVKANSEYFSKYLTV